MKKKIIGIAGSMKKKNSSSEYLLSVALEAAEELGVDTELIRLNDYRIFPCEGCGNCMDGKRCHILDNPEDQLTELYDKLLEADGFIFASPVYALSLPAVWKNWIDRCEPCTKEDLDFEYYNYDRVVGVKGKALQGKVAGQIVVAAGPGHEWAMASLIPSFTCVKLSMIASAGISLIEYDGQPGMQRNSWSKPVQEAEFAKLMARGVGIRVATALGFTYFDHAPVRKNNPYQDMEDILLSDMNDHKHTIKEITAGRAVVIVVGNQQASEKAKQICDKLDDAANGRYQCILAATVGTVPPFVTREFIKGKIGQLNPGREVYIDWEDDFGKKCGLPADRSSAIISNRSDSFHMIELVDDTYQTVIREFFSKESECE